MQRGGWYRFRIPPVTVVLLPNDFVNGAINGTYDPNDDSVLTFTFVRNCGSDSVENTYRLVKQ